MNSIKRLNQYVLIAFCLVLSACQSTSIREYSADQPNLAKQGLAQQTKQQAAKQQPPQENQLRMYVFSGYEHKADKKAVRQGYYIDFAVAQSESQTPNEP